MPRTIAPDGHAAARRRGRLTLARLRPLAAGLVSVALLLAGCESGERPGSGTHRVATLDEYKKHLAGADLAARHGAAELELACAPLREQTAAALGESIVRSTALNLTDEARADVASRGLLGARSEGRVLHLTNDVTITADGLTGWAQQMTALVAQDPADREQGWAAAAIRRLFDQVVLHSGEREVMVPVPANDDARCR